MVRDAFPKHPRQIIWNHENIKSLADFNRSSHVPLMLNIWIKVLKCSWLQCSFPYLQWYKGLVQFRTENKFKLNRWIFHLLTLFPNTIFCSGQTNSSCGKFSPTKVFPRSWFPRVLSPPCSWPCPWGLISSNLVPRSPPLAAHTLASWNVRWWQYFSARRKMNHYNVWRIRKGKYILQFEQIQFDIWTHSNNILTLVAIFFSS